MFNVHKVIIPFLLLWVPWVVSAFPLLTSSPVLLFSKDVFLIGCDSLFVIDLAPGSLQKTKSKHNPAWENTTNTEASIQRMSMSLRRAKRHTKTKYINCPEQVGSLYPLLEAI